MTIFHSLAIDGEARRFRELPAQWQLTKHTVIYYVSPFRQVTRTLVRSPTEQLDLSGILAIMRMYAHMIRNLVKTSGRAITLSRVATILIAGYATAFLGYAMVYGDMGQWATTVILSLLELIPEILASLLGDFSLG